MVSFLFSNSCRISKNQKRWSYRPRFFVSSLLRVYQLHGILRIQSVPLWIPIDASTHPLDNRPKIPCAYSFTKLGFVDFDDTTSSADTLCTTKIVIEYWRYGNKRIMLCLILIVNRVIILESRRVYQRRWSYQNWQKKSESFVDWPVGVWRHRSGFKYIRDTTIHLQVIKRRIADGTVISGNSTTL